ncbi:MAG: hypothetical protein LBS10_05295 [Gracilibacteraceae bacterium]|nr:hypothetical protein [Gracilibacteraceae bacterium]
MTKIGQLIQEEINEAAAKAATEAAAAAEAAGKKTIAGNLLRSGVAPSLVRDCTGLSLAEMEILLENLD